MGNSESAEGDQPDEVENEKVMKMEKMSVPTESANGWFSHEGVKTTTESGNEYMVHKVGKPDNDYETATVVESMSDPEFHAEDWHSSGFGSVSVEDRDVTVGNLVEESDTGYNVAFDNCQQAADRMMFLIIPSEVRGWLRHPQTRGFGTSYNVAFDIMDFRRPEWVRDLEWMEKQDSV